MIEKYNVSCFLKDLCMYIDREEESMMFSQIYIQHPLDVHIMFVVVVFNSINVLVCDYMPHMYVIN